MVCSLGMPSLVFLFFQSDLRCPDFSHRQWDVFVVCASPAPLSPDLGPWGKRDPSAPRLWDSKLEAQGWTRSHRAAEAAMGTSATNDMTININISVGGGARSEPAREEDEEEGELHPESPPRGRLQQCHSLPAHVMRNASFEEDRAQWQQRLSGARGGVGGRRGEHDGERAKRGRPGEGGLWR